MLVFLDSNIVIYLIEQTADWGSLALTRVEAMLDAGDEMVVSDLVRMECRVRPLAIDDSQGLADFDDFFASGNVRVVPITGTICDRAAAIRGKQRFRPLDALHLAAAIEQSCGAFLTHDRRLSGFPDLPVEILA